MPLTARAIYEQGILRPLEPLGGISERSQVTLSVKNDVPNVHPLAACVGSLPRQDADEMMRIVEEEFEGVDAEEW